MKNKIYFSIIVMTLTILMIIGKGEYIQATLNEDYVEVGQVEELLNKRAELMNLIIYNESNRDEKLLELRNLEKDEMLNYDLKMLNSLKDYPTDFSRVNSLKILEVKKYIRDLNRIAMDILIQWNISYNENQCYEENVYEVEVLKEDTNMVLTKFEFIGQD